MLQCAPGITLGSKRRRPKRPTPSGDLLSGISSFGNRYSVMTLTSCWLLRSHNCIDTQKPPQPRPLPKLGERGKGEGEHIVNTISRRFINGSHPDGLAQPHILPEPQ